MVISKKFTLLIAVLLLILFGNKNFLFIINLLALLYFFINGKIKKQNGILLLCLFIPILLAGIHGIFIHPVYDVFKDIYYLLNPLLFLILGLLIAKRVDIVSLFRAIVIVGTLFSIVHIIQVFMGFGISAFYDFREVRNEEGGGHIITTIALVLCIFSLYVYKLKLFKSDKYLIFFIIVNTLSFLFSGSRTYWIIFIILILTLLYPLYRYRIWVLVKSLILIAFLLALFLYYNSEGGLAKSIMNSSTELTIGDYNDLSDMNDKYRGWEAYRAFVTYNDGTVIDKFTGLGAGKMIDLGTYFFLADDYRRYIPILHNGYMYTLVKVGIIGSLCYLFYFIFFFRIAIKKIKAVDLEESFQPLLLIGVLISIIVSNIVISGFYNPEMELLGVTCGSLFYYVTNLTDIDLNIATDIEPVDLKS